jgi:hypothetical protein
MRSSRRLVLAALAAPLLATACSGRPAATPSASPTAPGTPASTLTPRASASASSCASAGPSAAASGPESNPPGDIPDTVKYVTYTGPGYHVQHPEGWAQSTTPGGVTFTDKYNSVRVEKAAAASAPTEASFRATELPALRATCFELRSVTTVTRRAGPALLVRYRADAAPDPVTGKVVRDDVERYEFWRNGTEVVLTLSGAVGADNVDPWRTVTGSFGWA